MVLNAAPGKVPDVVRCIRQLMGKGPASSKATHSSSSGSAVDMTIEACCLEYLQVRHPPLLFRTGAGSSRGFVPSEHNSLYQILATSADGGVVDDAVAQEIGSALAAKFKLDYSGTEDSRFFLSKFFVSFSSGDDEGETEVLLVNPESQKVVRSVPLRNIEILESHITIAPKAKETAEALFQAANAVLLPSVNEQSTHCISVTPLSIGETQDVEVVLNIAVEKCPPNGGWTARWTSTYRIQVKESGEVTSLGANLDFHAHYFEDGNVQMQTSKSPTVDFGGKTVLGEDGNVDPSSARSIMRVIRRLEVAHAEELEAELNRLADSSAFKALRRKLPVSKQLYDFNVAVNSAAAVATSALARQSEAGSS
jgi:hypothetical protein